MALKDEFDEEESIVLEPGTPTITICEEERQVMIPWISFRHALMEEGRLRLFYQGWVVELKGESLEVLWAELQGQSVRSISLPTDDGDQSFGIKEVSVEAV
ncbi:MAG: hypothetical protein ACJAQT_000063 [Akkermansiaceae bacterium]|jgi:hypothetical protein